MKYFHLSGEINEKSLDDFLQFINENEIRELVIVLNSVGGKKNLTHVLLDIINLNYNSITLISCGCYSASFLLFYKAKCKKKMTEGCVGMMHYSSTNINTMSNGQPTYSEDENIIKNWKERVKDEVEFVEKFMTPLELKKYKKGNDVYFTFKRMKEIFPDVEII
jgi:ATP-dependent protease ClpP protease subunit